MRPPTRALRPVIPNNACPLRLTAAAGTELAGASSGGTVTPGDSSPPDSSSLLTVLYTPKGVFTHAALLHQTCVHCAKFPTAASRRSLGGVSVPVWLIILSDQLPIAVLVGHYPTNKLIGRIPLTRHSLPWRGQLSSSPSTKTSVCGIQPTFAGLSPIARQVRYVVLTRLPCYSEAETPVRIRLACVRHAASVRSEP